MDAEGFSGREGRTTIFDYWCIDKIRRWRNDNKFNNRKLTPDEVSLQQFYSKVLNLCNQEDTLREGEFYDLMYANLRNPYFNPGKQYAFLRRLENELILVVTNFDNIDTEVQINIPKHVFEFYNLPEKHDVKAEGLSPIIPSIFPSPPTAPPACLCRPTTDGC